MNKSLIPSEAQEQKALVQWLNYHPILKNLFCKIDNEGSRKTVYKNGKAVNVGLFHAFDMGLRPGVSDLFIYCPSNQFNGLWLEVKRKKVYTYSERNKTSWRAQESFLETVRKVGYAGHFCFGFDHGKSIIENYMKN